MLAAALIVHIFHRILVYFTLLGCFLPTKYLQYHLIVWPVIILHWFTNNNRCFLSDLEVKLSGESWGKKESDFGIKVAKSFGLHITLEDTTRMYITFSTLSWLISFIRFIYE